ncbi:MAG: ATP-binding protein [Coriobacteriia bacterium]|nr:ATP-binding protein [Coriobacteriia bacterium]
MKRIVKTELELCTGCSRCTRSCPMEMANITYQDAAGRIKVAVDTSKCVSCGRCISACKHKARHYDDDLELFFQDLTQGHPLTLIAAPSIKTNIPEWKRLFTYLKNLGVEKIYNASFGDDLCVWSYVKYLRENDCENNKTITQPCPPIVSYCEMYCPDLLSSLAPLQSPMGALGVYLKKHEGITSKIAAFSPCIAKTREFEEAGQVDYNITFSKLIEYLNKNNVVLPEQETDFDPYAGNLESLSFMSDGLKENIEFFLGKKIRILQGKGYSVYKKLETYAETSTELLPEVFDVLNCVEGCAMGPACARMSNAFATDTETYEAKSAALEGRDTNYFKELYERYDRILNLTDFLREYRPLLSDLPQITQNDIEKAFKELNKATYEEQTIDCGACGSDTCKGMARKIALGVNIPLNCIVNANKEAEKQREQGRIALEQFETAWEHVECGIVLIDAETRVLLDANPRAVELYGESKDEIVGHRCDKLFCQNECPIMDLHQTIDRSERQFLKADGKHIPIIKSVSKVNYNGRPALLESFTDISSVKEANDQKRLAEIAEQMSQAKSAFLANMSHEIRTPMNAILGITEIQLKDKTLKAQAAEAFGRIHNSGNLLLGIINDVLDISKIEAGKLELTLAPMEMTSLINDTVQLNLMRRGSKLIKFELEVDERLPQCVHGDTLRIRQVLNNLLSNSFKYTESGSVKFSIFAEDCAGGENDTGGNIGSKDGTSSGGSAESVCLVFRVEDTGRGMTPDQLDKLFDEYSRFDQKANRITEGTGLGMSITQNLINLMDGDIVVESEFGKGTTFTVRLTLKPCGPEVLGPEIVRALKQFDVQDNLKDVRQAVIVHEPMPYGKVLIVDDVETNIYVAMGLLFPYGLEIDSVSSGFEALDKVKKGATYDIIFMDHMMPKMDGIEATKLIRELGYKGSIVALTANAVAGAADLFMENGFDDFISKPIDTRQMNAVLNRLVRDAHSEEEIAAARKEASARQA